MSDARITVYTTPRCPFCVRARDLLREERLPYDEVDVAAHPDERTRIHQEFGWWTVPAVFIDGELVGGFDELAELRARGELAPLHGSN